MEHSVNPLRIYTFPVFLPIYIYIFFFRYVPWERKGNFNLMISFGF